MSSSEIKLKVLDTCKNIIHCPCVNTCESKNKSVNPNFNTSVNNPSKSLKQTQQQQNYVLFKNT